MAGVKGRSGRKDTLWADALRVAVLREGADGRKILAKLAERVVDEALAGDIAAAKEVGDRLDGKPVQPNTHAGDEDAPPIGVALVERVIVRPSSEN